MYVKLVSHEFESRAERLRAALHSCPSRAILKRGASASFAYRSPGSPAAMIIAAGRQFPMTKGSDGVFRLNLLLPADAGEVKLALSDGGETYGVAVAWSAY